MPLKKYKTKDEIPEALRGDYVEKDGEWIPDVEDAESIYAASLKRSQREILDDLKKAQAKLKAYDGIDPAEYAKLKQAADEATAAAAKASGNWEAREKQLVEQYTKEIKKSQDEAASLRGTVEELVVENELRRELEQVAVDVDLALPHVRRHVRPMLDEATGRYVARVVDEKGQVRIADVKGTPMTIALRVKEWSEEPKNAPLVKGTGASGSGGRGSGTPPGGKKTIRAGDSAAFNANLDGIIKGDVVVVEG
jgi:hypothetical protein